VKFSRADLYRFVRRLASDSDDLLDAYRFWRERDPELKSLTASARRNPDKPSAPYTPL
jgi:hypothetical protein